MVVGAVGVVVGGGGALALVGVVVFGLALVGVVVFGLAGGVAFLGVAVVVVVVALAVVVVTLSLGGKMKATILRTGFDRSWAWSRSRAGSQSWAWAGSRSQSRSWARSGEG